MRRLVLLLILCSTVALSAIAQSSRVSFVAKGGMMTYMPYKDIMKPAPLGELFAGEVNYSFLWPLPSENEVGLTVGLHLAYGSPNMRIPQPLAPYSYTNYDYLGNQIDYTISINRVKEEIRQLHVGIPMMATGTVLKQRLRWSGGVRVLFPFALKYEQTLDADILAYYPAYGVEVPNELVTGKIMEGKHFKGKTSLPLMHFQVGGEVSYRLFYKRPSYIFQSGKSVCLGVFAFFTFATTRQHSATGNPIVMVNPIETAPPAEVVISPMNEVLGPKLFPFEIGLSASFDLTFTHRYNVIRHHSRHISNQK